MTSSDSASVAAALGRTRQSYDETPYISAPLMRSHPGRLAAQAIWRGLAAPDANTARVLEIGCASGGNILPLAAALPEASFVGVDISPVQIAAGEARRLRLGLGNVELRADFFEALCDDDGEFDFIICHGVYSWIPEPLRDSLLRTVSARLAPSGLALVSFNVLPGWRLFQIARDSMLLHERMIADPSRRAEATRELFGRLAAESANKHTYGKFWRDEAKRMAAGGDSYLAHEIFEELNSPVAFADFAARAAQWDLDYLSEAVIVANNIDDLAPDGAQTIRALAGADRLKRETYIDIFSGRSFREALLVRKGRAEELAPAPPAQVVQSLHFIPALDLELATSRDTDGVFNLSAQGTEIIVRNAAAEPVLRRLMERRPGSSRLADLASSATGELLAVTNEILCAAVEAGLLAVSTLPVECAVRLAERPKLWPIASMDAREGDRTVTLRHSAFQFAPLQQFLAPLVDGTRTRDDLVAAAVELATSGGLTVDGPDGPVTNPEEIRKRLENGADNALAGLLRNALLVAG